ncbi:hypothetical protein DUNSADRAFT_1594 [Dunaliella salina]|uniref:RanBD1 domain-containing protein n=1 Tax=Dunaliella salina TaxID=3046 RepID=A0ABQ7H8I3_DUNSA|nr:hypothetical protein DUNSADRAFT_1594 [Dunaliella salina]|eukprot:KAF5843167.1 hypothetical protein DUNSADRAFT_1594 [Dunaliella salina]
MEERADRPGKRRALDDKNKDNAEDDEEPSIDPGEWKPNAAGSDAVRGRRKVHVRRGGQPAPHEETAPPPPTGPPSAAAPANPFAGVTLTAPAAAAPANPFAGVNLVAPSSSQAPDKPEAAPPRAKHPAAPAKEEVPPAKEESAALAKEEAPPAKEEAPPAAATTASPATPSSAPATTSTEAPSKPPAAPEAAGSSTATAAASAAAAAPTAATPAAPLASAGTSGTAPSSTPAPSTTSSNPFSALGSSASSFGAGFGGAGFGGLGKAAAAGGGFGAFGSSPASSSAAAGTSGAAPVFGGFQFGAGAFPPVAAAPLGSKLPGQKPDGAEDGAEGQEQGEGEEAVQVFGAQGPSYQPVVSLPEQEKKTGEEEERQLYAADGSLYEFDTASNRWKERGRGDFKVNASEAGTRMVMRQAGNLRLLLNAKVYASMPIQLMPGNVGVTFGVVNAAASSSAQEEKEAATGEPKATEQQQAHAAVSTKPSTWAVRIKSSERVAKLKDLLMKLRENPKAEGIGGTDGGWDAA